MIDLEIFAERIKIPVLEIKRKTRLKEIVTARQIYWFYLHSQGYGFSEIGRMFKMNHSTVLLSIRKIENLITVNDRYLKIYLDAIEYK